MTSGATRQLWVLRHAKAEQHQLDDHGRDLTGRGRRQCAELAAHLAESGEAEAMPELVLVSSAVRACRTAELVLGALSATARVEVEPALYRADADGVVDLLRVLDDGLASVMVVGHNPTLEDLVWMLVGDDDGGRDELRHGLATCALAVVGLDLPAWTAVAPGSGELLTLYAPAAR